MRPKGSMRAPHLHLVMLVFALLAPACVPTVTSTYRDPRTFEPRKPEDVQVLGERPPRPHVVIATLAAEGEARSQNREELVVALRQEAARLGGDALVVYGDANTGQFVAAGILVGTAPTTRERHVMADVVVFADRAELTPAPRP